MNWASSFLATINYSNHNVKPATGTIVIFKNSSFTGTGNNFIRSL
ncbi:hypothetical protein [Pontibacter fetidus]|nr:hypothetical protein [Pontibacter fetidus]